jgi:DNA-binding Lrp family transcriptional regulator
MLSDATLRELVENSEEHWDRPFTTASDIADAVDMSRQGVYRRLEQLASDGKISKYQPGRSTIWFDNK